MVDHTQFLSTSKDSPDTIQINPRRSANRMSAKDNISRRTLKLKYSEIWVFSFIAKVLSRFDCRTINIKVTKMQKIAGAE